jgi:Protein of unknown function (DUF3159)
MSDPMTDSDRDDQQPEGPDRPADGLREQYRRQMLNSLGGWSGSVIAAVPTVVFVAVNAVWSLRAAVITAVASAGVLAAYRLARHQSTQQALSGLLGVVIASLIAERTGHAKGYFLLGILTSFAYAAVFLGSILVRRPIVGLLWEFLDPTPDLGEQPWYRMPSLLRAYVLATIGGGAVFLARAVVQLTLFRHNDTGWLAVARIAMGYPLYIAAVGYAFWVVRRARARLRSATESSAGPSAESSAEPPS